MRFVQDGQHYSKWSYGQGLIRMICGSPCGEKSGLLMSKIIKARFGLVIVLSKISVPKSKKILGGMSGFTSILPIASYNGWIMGSVSSERLRWRDCLPTSRFLARSNLPGM